MRVLFTGHFALDTWPIGWWMRDLGRALTWNGHEVRGLVAAGQSGGNDPFSVGRLVCRAGDAAADLDFAPPTFASEGGSPQTFEALDEHQISQYRHAWRNRLDREIDAFNPHVIHASHLWWDAQLALETGVPYVANAWCAELTACADQPAARAHAQQAAENASRIFVPHRGLGDAVGHTFSVAPEHLAVLPPGIAADRASSRATAEQRQAVLRRFQLAATTEPVIVVRATPDADSGIDVAINAAARLQAAAPAGGEALTIIASVAEPNPLWARQATRLGLTRLAQVRVDTGADWLALFQAADLAVFPARRLADGLDVLWTLSTGTPSIITAASGLDWLANCPAVRTIADGDHELLADAMLDALAGSWKAATGTAGAELVHGQHTATAMAERVAGVYRHVLTERFGQLPPH